LPDPEANPPELFLALANENDFPHRGVLDFRELGVDPATGTVERRGQFPNPDLALVPGMFVRIRAAIGEPRPKLLVEERALAADQRGDFVLVVNEDNQVEHRPVELGIQTEGLRVIEDGLAANEWIVVNGLQRARPGAPVNPEREPPAAETASAPTPKRLQTAASAPTTD
jgi:RND family efflux transporter MFP subunit